MSENVAVDSSGQLSCWSRLMDLGSSEAGIMVSKQMEKASEYANGDRNCLIRGVLATSVLVQTVFRAALGTVSFTARKLFSMATHLVTARIPTLITKDIPKLVTGLFRYVQATLLLPFYGLVGLAFPKRIYELLSAPGKLAKEREALAESKKQKELDSLKTSNESLTTKLTEKKDKLNDYKTELTKANLDKIIRLGMGYSTIRAQAINFLSDGSTENRPQVIEDLMQTVYVHCTLPGWPPRVLKDDSYKAIRVSEVKSEEKNAHKTGYKGVPDGMHAGANKQPPYFMYCLVGDFDDRIVVEEKTDPITGDKILSLPEKDVRNIGDNDPTRLMEHRAFCPTDTDDAWQVREVLYGLTLSADQLEENGLMAVTMEEFLQRAEISQIPLVLRDDFNWDNFNTIFLEHEAARKLKEAEEKASFTELGSTVVGVGSEVEADPLSPSSKPALPAAFTEMEDLSSDDRSQKSAGAVDTAVAVGTIVEGERTSTGDVSPGERRESFSSEEDEEKAGIGVSRSNSVRMPENVGGDSALVEDSSSEGSDGQDN